MGSEFIQTTHTGVCTSGDPADLALTDKIAADVVESIMHTSPPLSQEQYKVFLYI